VAGDDAIPHRGGCHCGAVAFEFDAPTRIVVQECNCSICAMTGFQHLIVPGARFRLLTSPDALAEYTFNTGTARHFFCKVCGIKSFYVPRSNPDGFSVNLRCVAKGTFAAVTHEPFDGQNWDAHGAQLAHLSRPIS
jgi:hypothetical protein